MTKKINSAADYAVNMINVMVDHDKGGAMEEWVDGIVRGWLIRLLRRQEKGETIGESLKDLSEDAEKLIIRAIMSITGDDTRNHILATCIDLQIISKDRYDQERGYYGTPG